MSTTPKVPKFWPSLEGKVHPDADLAIKMLFNATQQHDDAITAVNTKVTAAQATATAAAAANSPTTPATTPITTATFPAAFSDAITSTLGTVDNDVSTAKTIQGSNYGGLVTIDNAAPVVVTLNDAVTPNFFTFLQNLGTGNATLTPMSGNINGVATISLPPNTGMTVFWDGTDWWATTVPLSILSAVTSLNGETGAVTLTSAGATVAITTPTSGTINLEATGSGVPSVNGITGAVTIAAGAGATVSTAGSTITIGATGGAGYLKGGVTLTWSAGPFLAAASATVAGATVGMSALLMVPSPSASGTSFPIEQTYLSACVTAPNTVDCLYHVPTGNPSGGPTPFVVLVFP